MNISSIYLNWITFFLHKVHLYLLWKDFILKENWRISNGESHIWLSGKLNLKTERVISHKHLIYWKRKPPSINESPPRASPHPQDNEVCAWTVASYPPLRSKSLVNSPVAYYSFHVPNRSFSVVTKETQFLVLGACLSSPLTFTLTLEKSVESVVMSYFITGKGSWCHISISYSVLLDFIHLKNIQ